MALTVTKISGKNKMSYVIIENDDEDGEAIANGAHGVAHAYGKNGLAVAYGKYGLAFAHGKNGKAIVHGTHGLVRGLEIGCELIICNQETGRSFTEIVGKNGIQPDTWYGMNDDDFVEIEDKKYYGR